MIALLKQNFFFIHVVDVVVCEKKLMLSGLFLWQASRRSWALCVIRLRWYISVNKDSGHQAKQYDMISDTIQAHNKCNYTVHIYYVIQYRHY